MSLSPLEIELNPEERDALLDKVATAVVRRGLETPATLFLELHRPWTFFGSQGVFFLAPILGPMVGMQVIHRLGALLHDPENLDRLLDRIEEKAHEERRARKEDEL